MKENFSGSITKAEQMIGGNTNILNSLDSPAKTKSPSASSTTPVQARNSISSASTSKTPTVTSKGTYNSTIKMQNTSSSEQKKPNEKRFTCTMCTFTTDRINLLMMHIQGHSTEIQSRVNCKF